MDQSIFSLRQFTYVLAFSLICICLLSLSVYIQKTALYVCSESDKNTVVVKAPGPQYAVISNSRTQDVLSCIGHSFPFYQRDIHYLQVSADDTRREIQKRYNLLSEDDFLGGGYIDDRLYSEGVIAVIGDSNTYTVLIRKFESPFQLVKLIADNPSIIYSMQNSPILDDLMKNLYNDLDSEVFLLNNGEFVYQKL